ncbi:MAG: Na+:H+ antiporter, NhaA family [Sphingomonadales bacterium]|jgi:NhaA family Na+:H+ antiporter|nr:Na+:H+ antiporter, NhaA family [Sphingomonadales bacterium]
MTDRLSRRGARSVLRHFLGAEAAGGLVLIAASALALVVANGGWGDAYRHLLYAETGPVLSPRLGPMNLHLWINDGLMALFFLLVGLEIRREFVAGQLASARARRLPLIAAAAGMAVPALIYLIMAGAHPGLARGWAIPAATDIAFALAVLALLGPRVPTSLKLLLTTIAIADDLGAVAIIALAYTDRLDFAALGAAAAMLAVMYVMGRSGAARLWPFLVAAALLWYFVLLSGVHATIAGVLAAAFMPAALVDRLEHRLTPWVAFLVVPLFGFANAGVSLAGADAAALLAPLPLGIAAGLFLGKQIGIFGAVRLAVRFGLAPPPQGATWRQVHGVAMLCGIGFTMSLFIGALAFPTDPALVEQAKIGTLIGSFASALAGYALLRLAPPPGGRAGPGPSD